jgi:hypothetical protein
MRYVDSDQSVYICLYYASVYRRKRVNLRVYASYLRQNRVSEYFYGSAAGTKHEIVRFYGSAAGMKHEIVRFYGSAAGTKYDFVHFYGSAAGTKHEFVFWGGMVHGQEHFYVFFFNGFAGRRRMLAPNSRSKGIFIREYLRSRSTSTTFALFFQNNSRTVQNANHLKTGNQHACLPHP